MKRLWDEDKSIYEITYLDTSSDISAEICVAAENLLEAYGIANDYLNNGGEQTDCIIRSVSFVGYFIEPIGEAVG